MTQKQMLEMILLNQADIMSALALEVEAGNPRDTVSMRPGHARRLRQAVQETREALK